MRARARERERERERETCQRETSYVSYVPQLGIESLTFWCMGRCSNQLSPLGRATLCNFIVMTNNNNYHLSAVCQMLF